MERSRRYCGVGDDDHNVLTLAYIPDRKNVARGKKKTGGKKTQLGKETYCGVIAGILRRNYGG